MKRCKPNFTAVKRFLQLQKSFTAGQKFNSCKDKSNRKQNNCESDNRFIIHEGIKFRLIDEIDNWSRIELLDGNDGWIENNHFIKVY